MSLTLTVPSEYGYVLLAATASSIVSTWHSLHTGSYRRKAQVPYPNAYASAEDCAQNLDKYLFNCAQRAHANFQEAQPTFLVSLLIAGLKYPLLSAGMGVMWAAGRVVYTLGYMKRDMKSGGKGRYAGIWWNIPQLSLMVMSGLVGYSFIAKSIGL